MLKLSMAEDNYKNQSVFTKVLLNFKCVYTKNLGMPLTEKNEKNIFCYQQPHWEKKTGAHHHRELQHSFWHSMELTKGLLTEKPSFRKQSYKNIYIFQNNLFNLQINREQYPLASFVNGFFQLISPNMKLYIILLWLLYTQCLSLEIKHFLQEMVSVYF